MGRRDRGLRHLLDRWEANRWSRLIRHLGDNGDIEVGDDDDYDDDMNDMRCDEWYNLDVCNWDNSGDDDMMVMMVMVMNDDCDYDNGGDDDDDGWYVGDNDDVWRRA